MEYGKIEREIEIDASPAVVFEVITSPEHLTQWWPDEAIVEPTPGAVGELVFGDRSSAEAQIPQITVVDAEPSRLFSFRWVYPEGEDAGRGQLAARHVRAVRTRRGDAVADDRDRLPREGLGGRRARAAVPRARRGLGLLPAAARRLRARRSWWRREGRRRRRTLVGRRRSDPARRCSTSCWSTAPGRPPR